LKPYGPSRPVTGVALSFTFYRLSVFPHSVQTDPGAYTIYPIGTGDPLPGDEADHLPPFSVAINKGGAIPPLPHTSSWRGAYLLFQLTMICL
jgi:hypothetical protein